MALLSDFLFAYIGGLVCWGIAPLPAVRPTVGQKREKGHVHLTACHHQTRQKKKIQLSMVVNLCRPLSWFPSLGWNMHTYLWRSCLPLHNSTSIASWIGSSSRFFISQCIKKKITLQLFIIFSTFFRPSKKLSDWLRLHFSSALMAPPSRSTSETISGELGPQHPSLLTGAICTSK